MYNNIKECVEFIKWGIKAIKNQKCKKYTNQGVSVVVIGNGPSVSKFPLHEYKEKGFSFCCVNFFPIDEKKFFELRPDYYCIIDPGLFSESAFDIQNYEHLLRILSKVDWKMNVITIDSHKLPIENNNLSYQYINTNRYSGDLHKFKRFLYRNNLATCDYQNVIVAALYYFAMSEVDYIVLTGVENDWHRELFVDENNNVIREDTHFYGKNRLNLTEMGQIGKGELYKYFLYYYTTLYQYKLISEFANYQNLKIINTCLNSYIDVFSKMDAWRAINGKQ